MKRLKALLLSLVLIIPVFATVFLINGCSKDSKNNSFYQIEATYDPKTRKLEANMTVDYINNSDSIMQNVMFHLYPAAFREGARFSPIRPEEKEDAYPNGVSYGVFEILDVKRNNIEMPITIQGEDSDILCVDGKLLPNQKTKISISFMLVLPVIRYRYGYSDDIANLGNWYPIVCLIKDGEWDATPYYSNGDPFNSEVSDYKVSITVPNKYTVATSGKQTKKEADGQKTLTAFIKNARDFAAVIGEFKVLTKVERRVEVSYYYKEDSLAKVNLDTALNALRTFGEAFGSYAYETLAIVKNPFLYGGMEYPGLVYISDILSSKLFTEVIVHEIAHQWWYAAVGSDQIREAYLDEGLAEYSTTIFYERNKSYGVTKNERLASALSFYVLYCEKWKNNGADDVSMNRSCPEYATGAEYNVMTYIKGQLMYDELRQSIGDKAFFEGLKNYYKAFKFKRATTDDFIGIMEKASKTQLEGFFASFLEGKVKMFAS